MKKRLRILTWHIHGSYLYYLAQMRHNLYLPVREKRDLGYFGRTKSYPWPENVIEVPVEEVPTTDFDCVIYQHRQNWEVDRQRILSPAQRRLPQIYLEHDAPWADATDSKHWMDDPSVLLVHVTPFNRLMWDCGSVTTTVIDHGVKMDLPAAYSGELARGIVVVNNIATRGRRLGYDILRQARAAVPLDLVGMGWEQAGGLGEVGHRDLFAFMARYRFFFNPIRWTSLGLAVCEAMTAGVPVLGLATTEMVTAVRNGVNGYVETDPEKLIAHMKRLLADPDEARELSRGALRMAAERFSIGRFVDDWERVIADVVGAPRFTSSFQTAEHEEYESCEY